MSFIINKNIGTIDIPEEIASIYKGEVYEDTIYKETPYCFIAYWCDVYALTDYLKSKGVKKVIIYTSKGESFYIRVSNLPIDS